MNIKRFKPFSFLILSLILSVHLDELMPYLDIIWYSPVAPRAAAPNGMSGLFILSNGLINILNPYKKPLS